VYHDRNTLMTTVTRKSNEMATAARKHAPSTGRTPPRQPDYPDEIGQEQLNAIRKLVDPNGNRHETRELLHASGW
jgi:hypothetical protein